MASPDKSTVSFDNYIAVHLRLCGQTLTNSSGLIAPPDLDDDGLYDILTECSWLIEAAKDELIELKFLSMDIEIYTQGTVEAPCIFDYVQVKFMRGSRGGQTGGPIPSTQLKNHKNIGFLSNTCPDFLKSHKATKPAFNVGP